MSKSMKFWSSTAICPYKTKVTKGNEGHYISIGDNSGTLRLMTLPKHLWEPTDLALEDLQAFIDAEIAKKQEKERLKNDREKTRRLRFKKTIDEELEEDTKVVEPDEEYLIFYFQREKQVMSGLYGSDWRSYLKHPEWPREDYQVAGSRRSSSTTNTSALSTTRKSSIVQAMKGKAGTIAPFLKPGAPSYQWLTHCYLFQYTFLIFFHGITYNNFVCVVWSSKATTLGIFDAQNLNLVLLVHLLQKDES